MKPFARRFLSCLFLLGTLLPPLSAADGSMLVFIGTYTGNKSKGIYATRLDTKTGALTAPILAAEIASPSFLALHGNGRFLYAVNEVSKFEDKPAGAVTAFGVDAASGKLTQLNQQSSGGAGPCHLAVDQTGRCLLAANYGGGSIAAFPIDETGRLVGRSAFIQHQGSSVNAQRQKDPHAHHITTDPGNRFVLACDLGLDKILVYKLDPAKGTLTPNDPAFGAVAPGAGVRHLAFHPNGRFAYVINEILCTVTAFSFDSQSGALQEVQTLSTLPGSVERGYSTAEIAVHPSGKFLYGSNRGHDSIAVYSIDEASGKLTSVQNQSTQGKTPRNFGIDPTGQWLLAANQSSDTIVVFRINPSSGRLTPADQKLEVPSPVCVVFLQK